MGVVSGFRVTCSGVDWMIGEGREIDPFTRVRIEACDAEHMEERDADRYLGLI